MIVISIVALTNLNKQPRKFASLGNDLSNLTTLWALLPTATNLSFSVIPPTLLPWSIVRCPDCPAKTSSHAKTHSHWWVPWLLALDNQTRITATSVFLPQWKNFRNFAMHLCVLIFGYVWREPYSKRRSLDQNWLNSPMVYWSHYAAE